jgi:hypothetical protein
MDHAWPTARTASQADAHLFLVKILTMYQQRGDASLIVKAARDPRMPKAYLWWVIFEIAAERHPDAVAICEGLKDPLPEGNVTARETLLMSADQHPDALVRLEAAWAFAKTGSELGRRRLAQLCLNPHYSQRAVHYLEELGLGEHIPSRARAADFRAMAEMCSWLMHPNECGRPPDEITQYDTRELNWPPTGDRRRFCFAMSRKKMIIKPTRGLG